MNDFQHPLPPPKPSWHGKSALARQAWSRTFYINHPSVQILFDDCRQKLDQCSRTNRYDAMLVLGGTGSGKTTLCRQLVNYAIQEFSRNEPEKTIIPVIQFAIPDPCTPLEISIAILQALGDPAPRGRRHKAETISAAALLLRTCDVRLVLVDNTQDIPARRARRGIELVGARLREFIDSSRAVWVFLGTDDALKVVNSDPQLVKRICYRGQIPYFTIADVAGQKNFRRLLKRIDEWLPLVEASCLLDPKLAGPIHIATEGIFDRLVQLIDRGWYEAWQDGRETMTQTDLAKAFSLVYGPQASLCNPFSEGFITRRLHQPGDPFEVLRGAE